MMIVIDLIPKRVDPHRAVMCIIITLSPFLNGLPVSFANLWKCSSGRKINFSAAMNVLTYANGPMLVSNVHTDFQRHKIWHIYCSNLSTQYYYFSECMKDVDKSRECIESLIHYDFLLKIWSLSLKHLRDGQSFRIAWIALFLLQILSKYFYQG